MLLVLAFVKSQEIQYLISNPYQHLIYISLPNSVTSASPSSTVMMDLSTVARPLDDQTKAEHLTQLQTTLKALAGTGLFTQKDAAQYFTQVARLVHIQLASQCNMHPDINTEITASNLGEGQSANLEYMDEESSETESATRYPDDNLARPRKRNTIRNLKSVFPKWANLLTKKSKLNLMQGARED